MKKFVVLFIAIIFLVPMVAIGADMYGSTKAVRSISPTTNSGNTATVGQIIDGIGYRSILYVINVATVADNDATFTPLLEACDNNACSDAATATGLNLQGTFAAATFTTADNNSVYMLEYTGTKRYTRLTITPANNSGAATFSAIAIKGRPQYLPTQ